MMETLTNLAAEAELLIQAVVVVFAIGMVVATWARTKSAVPTVATLVLAAVVIWGVNNIDVLEREVNEDLNQTSMPPLGATPGTAVGFDV
ncbi:MAG TPA: hypothetical protein VFK43_03555 [Acidimicrobiales bacterium]|nr:hypothetical protein [Acidimicrobiales bacterium]